MDSAIPMRAKLMIVEEKPKWIWIMGILYYVT